MFIPCYIYLEMLYRLDGTLYFGKVHSCTLGFSHLFMFPWHCKRMKDLVDIILVGTMESSSWGSFHHSNHSGNFVSMFSWWDSSMGTKKYFMAKTKIKWLFKFTIIFFLLQVSLELIIAHLLHSFYLLCTRTWSDCFFRAFLDLLQWL